MSETVSHCASFLREHATKSPIPSSPFHDGSFKIAEKGGVPVVPMTIVNSASIFEDHLPKMKKADVIIEFHKPIMISELDKAIRKNIGNYISGLIQERYFALKEEYNFTSAGLPQK